MVDVVVKNKIKPIDIKANIYNNIEIIVDIDGVAGVDLDYIQKKIKALFSSDIYNFTETELYDYELNDLNERKPFGMSIFSRKRLIEKESVLRFSSKDENEQVSISRLFVNIKLDYKAAHCLTEKIQLMCEIIECFSELDYFQIERISLNKSNNIVCNSLYKLYQCFEKNMFGDIAYILGRKIKNIDIEPTYLSNKNYFKYDGNEINVFKMVKNGILNDNGKKIVYEGTLNINTCYDCMENGNFNYGVDIRNTRVNVKDKIEELNEILFDIFIGHITQSFIQDLVSGKTDKVLGGFNINE